ncbi:MAG TPA: cysteine desulfurase-like protein [Thermoanaerobaculia bacterium]|jgi:cysteine desulfurase family protein (TIGR01976 family)|nr:cysteine desulfurase-like protein [Thermoanaerobaculia bacterium]
MNIQHSAVSSVDDIREHFPALDRIHNGQPVSYFDAPGGTQVPRVVAEAMTDYLFHHNANTHWFYPTSEETDAIIERSRDAVADLLNADRGEIVFGANMTTLTFHLARALGRTWQSGDEVIVTELDHHANVAPWKALEVDRGIVVRTAQMIPETAQLDYEHMASLVSPRTKLIAAGAASNAVGTINDLGRVRAIARDAGALFFVDAVHLVPHELIDVRDLGCDFLACSSYKFYGPHAGILFARRELLDALPFPKLAPAPDWSPERAETGTQNHEAIAGIGATVDFLASLGGDAGSRRERLTRTFATLHARGDVQLRMLWNGLTSLPRVRVYGPPPGNPRTPTVSFTIDGIHPDDIARRLASKALFASNGDFYALTCIERLGCPDGVVRIGCAAYTKDEEVARLIEEVARIA